MGENSFDAFVNSAVDNRITERTYEEITNIDLGIAPQAFANEILKWCGILSLKEVTHLKLQKLLYYCYSVYVWSYECMPFSPHGRRREHDHSVNSSSDGILPFENLAFYKFGPFSPVVYHELKVFGSNVLGMNANDFAKIYLKREVSVDSDLIESPIYSVDQQHVGDVEKVVKYVLFAIGHKKPFELVEMTHVVQSAWHIFYEKKSTNNNVSFVLEKILNELSSYNCLKDLYNINKSLYV